MTKQKEHDNYIIKKFRTINQQIMSAKKNDRLVLEA